MQQFLNNVSIRVHCGDRHCRWCVARHQQISAHQAKIPTDRKLEKPERKINSCFSLHRVDVSSLVSLSLLFFSSFFLSISPTGFASAEFSVSAVHEHSEAQALFDCYIIEDRGAFSLSAVIEHRLAPDRSSFFFFFFLLTHK